MPYDGINVLILPDGWTGVQSTQGPMTRSVDDLELYMQLMCDAEPWHKEPGITVKPWVASKGPGRKLKVGIMRDNGVVAPVAAISRAVETAVERLKKNGNFEIKEYKPFESQRAWDIIKQIYWPDGGALVMEHLERSGEEVRPLTKWIIEQSGNAGRQLTTEELFGLVSQRDDFRTQLAAHWAAADVDVVLTPVGPTPAPIHGTAKYWNVSWAFSRDSAQALTSVHVLLEPRQLPGWCIPDGPVLRRVRQDGFVQEAAQRCREGHLGHVRSQGAGRRAALSPGRGADGLRGGHDVGHAPDRQGRAGGMSTFSGSKGQAGMRDDQERGQKS